MTYIATDRTRHGGNPVHLIRFDYQSTTYRYSTGVSDFDDGSHTWIAHEISPIEDMTISDNVDRSPITLKTKLTNPVAQLFRSGAIESSVTCLIYEVHETDGEMVLIHSGRILGRYAKLEGKKREIELKSEPIMTATKRPSIRERSGELCGYVLYDTCLCRATKNSIPGVVTAINGSALVVSGASSAPDGYLRTGYIETSQEKRMITYHSGDNIEVTTVMQGLEVGDTVTMYIGCNHTTSDCNNKHSNLDNFGGEPFIPRKNPHEGSIV